MSAVETIAVDAFVAFAGTVDWTAVTVLRTRWTAQ